MPNISVAIHSMYSVINAQLIPLDYTEIARIILSKLSLSLTRIYYKHSMNVRNQLGISCKCAKCFYKSATNKNEFVFFLTNCGILSKERVAV